MGGDFPGLQKWDFAVVPRGPLFAQGRIIGPPQAPLRGACGRGAFGAAQKKLAIFGEDGQEYSNGPDS